MQNRERKHSSSSSHVLIREIILVIFCSIIISIESKEKDGFSTELIHIDSPGSPFYKLNSTFLGLRNYTEQIGSLYLMYDRGLYLMKISYGSPKVKYYHIIDTGSEISWIQCFPCTHCFPSKYSPFQPNNSKTFHFEKDRENKTCPYDVSYEDGKECGGELAKDTITVGSGSNKREFKTFLFGCGHKQIGNFPYNSAGTVGLNPEKFSFIFQLRESNQGKFSYCLGRPGSTNNGKISFGNRAIVSGNDVMTTPLVLDTFYNIMLESIIVGKHKLKYFRDSHLSSHNSNQMNDPLKTIVDTGTNLIYLPHSLYSDVETRVQKYITTEHPIGAQGRLKLCYSSSLQDSSIPKIKLHFPGVVLKLNPVNTFPTINTHRCLAIMPHDNFTVLGSMAQINFLVGIDLTERIMSFKPTNCATL